MRLFSLDDRLSLVSSLVRPNKRIVDVGTDHAYLPIYLVYKSIIPSAIATDINEGPLKSGKERVLKYQLNDKIELRLCDGLDNIKKDEIDDIVIAGMGGELIINILSKCDFIKDKHLVLQPMTKYPLLIKWLYDNDYEIDIQKTCQSNNKFYTVISANYTGKKISYSKVDLYLGKLNTKDSNDVLFLRKQLKNLSNQSKNEPSLSNIIDIIKGEINHD